MSATATPPTIEDRTSALLACSDGKPVILLTLDPVSGTTTISSVGVDETQIPGFLARMATALSGARH
jgi:hypothetical protein